MSYGPPHLAWRTQHAQELILVFGFRFFIEFFRDPMTNHGWGEAFWGIKQIQWLLLLLVLLFGTFLWLR